MYQKKSEKLYCFGYSSTKEPVVEKCLVRLKTRYMKIEFLETNSTETRGEVADQMTRRKGEYKLTPFTTVTKTEATKKGSNSKIYLVVITDLERQFENSKNWNQRIVEVVKLICNRESEADMWCKYILNNVAVLTQKVFESKLTKYNCYNSSPSCTTVPPQKTLATHSHSQNEDHPVEASLIHVPQQHAIPSKTYHDQLCETNPFPSPFTSMQDHIYSFVKTNHLQIRCCGYLFRKNYEGYLYQKPSFLFASVKVDEILFYKTHAMSTIADVIGCRVNIKDANVGVSEVPGSFLAFTLTVDGTPCEVFAASDPIQRNLWIDSLNAIINKYHGRARDQYIDEIAEEKAPIGAGPNEEEQGGEADDSTGTFRIKTLAGKDDDRNDNRDDDDDDSEEPTGTFVIHTKCKKKQNIADLFEDYGDGMATVVYKDDDDDGDNEEVSTMIVKDECDDEEDTGEPDIFGLKNKNVFNSNFWDPPLETATTILCDDRQSDNFIDNDSGSPEKVLADSVKNLTLSENRETIIMNLTANLEKKTNECEALQNVVNELTVQNKQLKQELDILREKIKEST